MFDDFKKVLAFKRAVLFLYGAEDIYNTKVASSLLRYRNNDIFAIISDKGQHFFEKIYAPLGVKVPPVYSSINELGTTVDAMIICLMLPSGVIPREWELEIVDALKMGIALINPLHTDFAEVLNDFLQVSTNNNKWVSSFKNTKGHIYNIRIPEDKKDLLSLEVLNTKAKRVLTVGTDCNVGKMLSSIELTKKFKEMGFDSRFLATGQIGILISGNGTAVDNVISDFLPAYVEELVLEARDSDIVFVEGQGSIFQPLYSAVTMGLIHGVAPDYMVLTHVPGRLKLRYTDIDMPKLQNAIELYERLAKLVNPNAKITGISLNTYALSMDEAYKLIEELEDRLGLPVSDPVKFNDIDKLIPMGAL